MKIKFVKNAFGHKADHEMEINAEELKSFGDAVVEIKEADADVAKAADEYAAKVDAQIEEKVNASVAKALKKAAAKPSIHVGPELVETDPKRGFKNFGDFLMAVKTAEGQARCKAAGLNGGAQADGGYALPPQFSDALVNGVRSAPESLISKTFNINLTGDGRTMAFPSIVAYDQSSTDPTKIPVANWLAEGATKTTSKPQFEIVNLQLKKLAAVLPATDEMLQDFGALESVLTGLGVDAINRAVNSAILRGNGSTQPTGVIGHAATVAVSRSSYGASEDVYEMLARFSGDRSKAVWVYHPSILPELAHTTVGNYPVFMPAGGISAAPYETLLGIPMVASEDASADGTAGDLMLLDLSKYATLTKGGIDVQSSIHVYFLTDETAYRFVYRVDGKPVYTAPITPKHGSDTLSPFVVRT